MLIDSVKLSYLCFPFYSIYPSLYFRSIPDIMYKSDMQVIDFLKVDIEGAEVALFDSAHGRPDLWLPKVWCFSIEVRSRS
jgi:hypothetical protein